MKGQRLSTVLLSVVGGAMVCWTVLYTPPGIGLRWSSLTLAAPAATPSSTNLPAHAIRRPGGDDWKCARGYRREGEHCVRVQVPPYAFLDYFGHDWECTRGYRREGDRCVRLQVPPHAFLDFSGHAWACERGYRQAGDRCIPVQVPPYAFLNYFGHDWECTRGYRREGDRCVSVQPGQASLARTGEAATGAAFPRDELAQLATDVYTNREALHDWQTIAHLQRQLHQAGYDPGPIDGLLGPRTLEVLRQFLADRGLLPEATSRATTSSAPES